MDGIQRSGRFTVPDVAVKGGRSAAAWRADGRASAGDGGSAHL